ncbi:MAG: diacylglycerol kinase [Gammaproteobacteria bacterium]|nr:diacylglycerol kinase [Gammaproteobacteria bacterium]
MADSGNKGVTRIVKASGYSWQGLRAAYRHEAAFRQETWLCIVLVPLGLYLGSGGVEKALLVASVILLPLIEIINSAVEAVVDRFGGEQHELSGRAKDMGSAAVALAIGLMTLVWVLVLFVD